MSTSEERLRSAFDDLRTRVAADVATDEGGPHQVPAEPGPSASDGRRRPALIGAAAAVAAALVGSAVWVGAYRDGDQGVATGPSSSTTNPTATPTGPPVDGPAVGRFDQRSGTDVFVLTDRDGALVAGFASALHQLRALPPEAIDAEPDGAGGVVYLTPTGVWQLAAGVDAPRLLDSPGEGVPMELVGLRHVAGVPLALVRLGDKLVGYGPSGAPDDRRLVAVLAADLAGGGFGGHPIDVAVDGTTVAAVVAYDDGSVAVEAGLLPTGEGRSVGTVRRVTAPVPAGGDGTPRLVAVAGDEIVVVDGTATARLVAAGGTGEVSTLALPMGPGDVPLAAPSGTAGRFTLDAAGSRVLVGFVESAMTIDLVTGDRPLVGGGLTGSVLSATLADPPMATAPEPVGTAGQWLRVDTARVAADTADPFLNARHGAGADAPLLAKLPPTYRGLRATGATTATPDGATWIEVELTEPVPLHVTEPIDGRIPTGWVNAAFVVPVAGGGVLVGADEVPACSGRDLRVPAAGAGAGTGADVHVASLSASHLSNTCDRIVVSLLPGPPPATWEAAPDLPAGPAALPAGAGGTVGRSTVDLGPVAAAGLDAVDEVSFGAYLVRGDDGYLDLVLTHPARALTVTALPGEGRLVIDADLSAGEAPPAGAGVVLTQPPVAAAGSVELTGIARPFEANLGVTVVDAAGRPVSAVYSGDAGRGTVRADGYGVSTTDWSAAWGRFTVRAEGLAPGAYRVLLDAEGGSDRPRTLSVPVTVTEAGTGPELVTERRQRAALALLAFARGGPFAEVPLADGVTLGLGLAERREVAGPTLGDRRAWAIDAPGFAGVTGPFNALDHLASGPVRMTAGTAPHCAGPALEWPADLDRLQPVTIEPIGIDSCVAWYAVTVFFDDSDRIRGVVLDRWEP